MFVKKNIIFKPKKVSWIKSHAWVPTPYLISKSKIIVYFAGRNHDNESDIGYFIYDLVKNKVINFSKKPVLKRGALGTFDDSAVIPSHVIKIKNKYYLYYIGWTQGKKIPYISNIGLAISKNLKGSFKKHSESPVLGRNFNDPYFVASCFVRNTKKQFVMDYTSNLFWKKLKKNTAFPRYLVKTCTSKNGINWKTNKKITIKFHSKNEVAITRPWIIKKKRKYYMFLSLKKKHYQIIVSESKNGFDWKRNNKKIFFEDTESKFDTISQEYASIVRVGSKLYMFYNGNNYGENGVGLAIANYDDLC